MNSERRKYTRFNVPLSVKIKKGKYGTDMISGTTVNFSRSGMCVTIEGTAAELKDAVEMKVQVPGKDTFIPAVGDVVWTESRDDTSLAGIRLVAMNQEAKFYILSYCNDLE